MMTEEEKAADAKRAELARPKASWKYISWLLVGVAAVAGLAFFIPDRTTPEARIQQERRLAAWEAKVGREAEEKRKAAEVEELGLIYIAPGTNPFPTKPPADEKKPAKKKPAPDKSKPN